MSEEDSLQRNEAEEEVDSLLSFLGVNLSFCNKCVRRKI